MKVTSKKEDGFTPFELTFRFESAEEVNAFWCLFNHTTLTHFIYKHGKIDDAAVREQIVEALGDYPDYRIYQNLLTSMITKA